MDICKNMLFSVHLRLLRTEMKKDDNALTPPYLISINTIVNIYIPYSFPIK